MKKVKGFSYDTITDKDVIEHIDKQGNGSQYIWSLVRNDMKDSNIQEIIQKEVNRYLKETAERIKNRPISKDRHNQTRKL